MCVEGLQGRQASCSALRHHCGWGGRKWPRVRKIPLAGGGFQSDVTELQAETGGGSSSGPRGRLSEEAATRLGDYWAGGGHVGRHLHSLLEHQPSSTGGAAHSGSRKMMSLLWEKKSNKSNKRSHCENDQGVQPSDSGDSATPPIKRKTNNGS